MSGSVILIGYEFRDPPTAAMIERLRAIDPAVRIVYAPMRYDAAVHAQMRAAPRDELLGLTSRFPADYLAALSETEILFTLLAPVDLLKCAPRVRWVANAGSGTDQYNAHGILGSRVILTSAKF